MAAISSFMVFAARSLRARRPKTSCAHPGRFCRIQSEWIERRTRVKRIFPDHHTRLRQVTALVVDQPEEWLTDRLCLDMREREEHPVAKNGKGE